MKGVLGRIALWVWMLTALGDYAWHLAASFWAGKGGRIVQAWRAFADLLN